jgi:hypothetical protein
MSISRLCFLFAALLMLGGSPVATAAAPRFERTQIAGTIMQLPVGWQRQQDDYGLILTENRNDEDSPVLALIGVQGQPGQQVAPRQIADTVLAQLDPAAQGIVATLVEERDQNGALYRLYRLQEGPKWGYLVSYTYSDANSGAIVHLFFSALEQRFVELGGPVLPLVVFAGLAPATIDQVARNARASGPVAQANAAAGHSSPSDEAAAYALASRISQMSHETSMKILYNSDSGWCYRGESDCE